MDSLLHAPRNAFKFGAVWQEEPELLSFFLDNAWWRHCELCTSELQLDRLSYLKERGGPRLDEGLAWMNVFRQKPHSSTNLKPSTKPSWNQTVFLRICCCFSVSILWAFACLCWCVRFHCILVAERCKPELKLSTCKCIPAQEIKLLNAMRDCCKTVLYYGWSSVWPLCLDKVPAMGTQQGWGLSMILRSWVAASMI
jgi:hypothetical protein